DTNEINGLASITNNLMLLGSDQINEKDLANKFTDIGAQLDSEFDQDKSGFSLRTLSEKKLEAFNLFKIVMHKPNFDSAILNREKIKYYASISQGETEPDAIANKAFLKAIYGSHPYALSGSGTINTIEKLTIKDLIYFYKSYYSSSNASIVIVGDLTVDEAKLFSEDLSNGLPEPTVIQPYTEVLIKSKEDIKISHPSSQAHLLFGAPIMKRGDPDFFPLYVGNYILGGGGFSSRLTEEVREKKGLVYSVYSYFMPLIEKGPFQVGLQTKKDQIDEALNLVKSTINKFISDGPSEKELQAAKDNLIGGFPMRLDSNKKILDYLTMMAFYDYPVDYLDTFSVSVNKVT
ncbi:MAG TPA: peptidase M16, partial [Methylophilaceae bacterium]|nr:peptidase M16 [Methylophilaceae bacterium]